MARRTHRSALLAIVALGLAGASATSGFAAAAQAEPPKPSAPPTPPKPATPPPSPPKDEMKPSIEYWPNSKVPKYKYEMRKDTADGKWKRNGPSQAFYASGVLEREGDYRNNERVGTWKYYDAAGKLIRTEERGGANLPPPTSPPTAPPTQPPPPAGPKDPKDPKPTAPPPTAPPK